jgi:hypothetical protein
MTKRDDDGQGPKIQAEDLKLFNSLKPFDKSLDKSQYNT